MLKVAELDEIERQYIKHHDLEKQLRGERKIRKMVQKHSRKGKEERTSTLSSLYSQLSLKWQTN